MDPEAVSYELLMDCGYEFWEDQDAWWQNVWSGSLLLLPDAEPRPAVCKGQILAQLNSVMIKPT